MTILMQAHHEWATRPDDQRFTSLDELLAFARRQKQISRPGSQLNKAIEARPIEGDRKALAILGVDEQPVTPTHWAFGQLSSLVGAPAAYLRTLPSDLASDCLNQSMLSRKRDRVGFLCRGESSGEQLHAVTGVGYGRIWNEQIVEALVNRFGSGPSAEFTVPGEFGRSVPITKRNTTLFASDRDMFVFLADERNKIEVPNRRGGQPGYLSRGFFVRNSEVGAAALKVGTFLFDYVCANRIVWGAENFQEVSIRHTSGAPGRWLDEVAPALHALAESDTFAIEHALSEARQRRLDEDAVDKVLAKRFTTNQAKAIKLAHMNEEGRPMESAWDVITGATAYAKGIEYQDERIQIERNAGAILAEVAR